MYRVWICVFVCVYVVLKTLTRKYNGVYLYLPNEWRKKNRMKEKDINMKEKKILNKIYTRNETKEEKREWMKKKQHTTVRGR